MKFLVMSTHTFKKLLYLRLEKRYTNVRFVRKVGKQSSQQQERATRDARVLQFKNYIEEWEADRIGLKNDKCRDSLLEKYMHVYLYDEGEVRRVIDAVWATTSRPAKYQVVTQFIETINADDLINADQENVNYLINAELHQCIKAARDIPNKPY